MVKAAVPVDDPRFGKLLRCPNNKVTDDLARIERLQKVSNLAQFAHCKLENFNIVKSYPIEQQDSLEAAARIAAYFADYPGRWLLLEGPYGCGKTHLAAAVGNARLKSGYQVLFITSPDLLDYLRSSFSSTAEADYDTLLERIRSTDVLIIDDLGVENPSAWAQEKLFQILNYRYAHRKETVITTNARISDMDGRIRSRLMDQELVLHVRIDAPDYRSQSQEDDPIVANLQNYADMRFDTFDMTTHLYPAAQRNLENAMDYAKGFVTDHGTMWFVLMGPKPHEGSEDMRYGTGKTHLAASIGHARRALGDQVAFATVPDLMDYLRESFNGSSSYERRFNLLRNIDLLIIDDLQTIDASNWTKEKIFQILDYRYVRKMPTVFTLPHLGTVDPRLRNRLADPRRCLMFQIQVPAYNLRISQAT